jgi:DNA-binding phage protein
MLPDLVNAAIGLEELAKLTGRPAKSLHRMLSLNSSPSMDNLAAIFDTLCSTLAQTMAETIAASRAIDGRLRAAVLAATLRGNE